MKVFLTSEAQLIIFENKTLSKMLVSLTKGQRSKLDVTFTEAVDYLAIEADITTVEAEE